MSQIRKSMVDVHDNRSARDKRRKLSDDLNSFPWLRQIVSRVERDDVDKVRKQGANIDTPVPVSLKGHVPK
jgi:hypothetical protein